MTQRILPHMTAPLREDFDISYHDIGSEHGPPRIALVAGLHGNELNGVFVLSRLAAFLQEVAEGQQAGLQLRERAIIIPAVNILGLNTLNRHWPFDNTDINRMFPGYDAGETTQRIAHAVLEVTRLAHYRVDLHSASLDFEELPQVRLYDPTEDERAKARLFGLPAVIERPTKGITTRSCQDRQPAASGTGAGWTTVSIAIHPSETVPLCVGSSFPRAHVAQGWSRWAADRRRPDESGHPVLRDKALDTDRCAMLLHADLRQHP
jgi:hypothetical protein